MFFVKHYIPLELTSKDEKLIDSLIDVASDYVTGISEQFGELSLERIEASGYWMDLVARRKRAMKLDSHTIENRSLMAIISQTVSTEAASVYGKYFEDYIF